MAEGKGAGSVTTQQQRLPQKLGWIERRFKNDLNLRRYRVFKKNPRAVFSLGLLVLLSFFSLTAEFWSNSRPLWLRYDQKQYFPVFKDPHPSALGLGGSVIDYRKLPLDASRGDSALWTLNRWDPYEYNVEVSRFPAPPSADNWLGTDDRGRDILARLLYGFRYSMAYAVIVWGLTVLVGVSIGGVMGYFGGWVDLVGQRFVEILNTVPIFFLLIILISIFEPTLWLLVGLTSLFSWISLSYYVRGEFLKNRKMEFVSAARSLGAGPLRIIFKHVLPNSLVPVITFSPFIVSSHVLGLASLDYLGFGLRPPTPSWGELLNEAQKHFTTAWWLAVYPGVALFTTLVVLALIGEGVRGAFDPKKA